MKEVARSEVLSLGHANDITYIPETNELYVIHVVNRKVSILDADTLTVKDTVRMQFMDSYAIEYNPQRNEFVTGIASAGMGIFDRDLKVQRGAECQGTGHQSGDSGHLRRRKVCLPCHVLHKFQHGGADAHDLRPGLGRCANCQHPGSFEGMRTGEHQPGGRYVLHRLQQQHRDRWCCLHRKAGQKRRLTVQKAPKKQLLVLCGLALRLRCQSYSCTKKTTGSASISQKHCWGMAH